MLFGMQRPYILATAFTSNDPLRIQTFHTHPPTLKVAIVMKNVWNNFRQHKFIRPCEHSTTIFGLSEIPMLNKYFVQKPCTTQIIMKPLIYRCHMKWTIYTINIFIIVGVCFAVINITNRFTTIAYRIQLFNAYAHLRKSIVTLHKHK